MINKRDVIESMLKFQEQYKLLSVADGVDILYSTYSLDELKQLRRFIEWAIDKKMEEANETERSIP